MREAATLNQMVILPISARARRIVRAAGASPDKTFFMVAVEEETAIAEAVQAGYLAPLRGHHDIWRITARGEAYLGKLQGAH